MNLSNIFPQMSDSELDQWIKHRGTYTVQYWDSSLGDYVASTMVSICFFFDKCGWDDTPLNRGAVFDALAFDGKFSANDVTIFI